MWLEKSNQRPAGPARCTRSGGEAVVGDPLATVARERRTSSTDEVIELEWKRLRSIKCREGILAEQRRYSAFKGDLIIRDFFEDRQGGHVFDCAATCRSSTATPTTWRSTSGVPGSGSTCLLSADRLGRRSRQISAASPTPTATRWRSSIAPPVWGFHPPNALGLSA